MVDRILDLPTTRSRRAGRRLVVLGLGNSRMTGSPSCALLAKCGNGCGHRWQCRLVLARLQRHDAHPTTFRLLDLVHTRGDGRLRSTHHVLAARDAIFGFRKGNRPFGPLGVGTGSIRRQRIRHAPFTVESQENRFVTALEQVHRPVRHRLRVCDWCSLRRQSDIRHPRRPLDHPCLLVRTVRIMSCWRCTLLVLDGICL